MKHVFTAVVAGLLAVAAQAAQTDGVKPGEFTMDYEAAKAYAAEKKLPLLINFSGSDWCGWCRLMDENVFSKPEWTAYASNHVVMVLIDFPQDKSLVPEKYADRNQALSTRFGIEGFPTFVVLDDDGETELGRLQAGQDKTPSSFKGELERLFRNRPVARATLAASLSPEDRAAFEKLQAALAGKQAELKTAQDAATVAAERAERLTEEIQTLEGELKEFRIARLGEDKLKAYKELQVLFDQKMEELQTWINSGPEQNAENMAKFEAMRTELLELSEKIEAF